MGGVNAFLVLSAFFLTRKLYAYDEIKLGKECFHRIKRLYPAYTLLLLSVSLLYLFCKHQWFYDLPLYFLSAQNFYHAFISNGSSLSGILGHTWYISLDVYLFFLWVLLLKITPRDKWRWLCFLGILFSIVWRMGCNMLLENRQASYTLPFGQMDSWCIGALLALNMIGGRTNKKYQRFDFLIGCCGILACICYAGYTHGLGMVEAYRFFSNSANYTGDPILVNVFLFVGLFSAGLLRVCLKCKQSHLLNHKWMVVLGNWSYELYLFHYPILWILGGFVGNRWLLIVVALSVTILSAYLWYRFVQGQLVNLLGK